MAIGSNVGNGYVLVPPEPDSSGKPCSGSNATDLGRFGSSHSGVPMVMLDGAVHTVDFSIDPTVFAMLAMMNNAEQNCHPDLRKPCSADQLK